MATDVNEDDDFDALLASYNEKKNKGDDKSEEKEEENEKESENENENDNDDEDKEKEKSDNDIDKEIDKEKDKDKVEDKVSSKSKDRDDKDRKRSSHSSSHRSRHDSDRSSGKTRKRRHHDDEKLDKKGRDESDDHRRDRYKEDKTRRSDTHRHKDRKDSKKSHKSAASREEGGGLRDMSVNEMNGLRAQLGLKPLQFEDKRNEMKDIEERERERKMQEAMELEDKIELLKRKRMKREKERKRQKTTTLGDSESDNEDNDNALNWVEKSRQIREEQRLAEQKANILKHLKEDDDSDSYDDPVALREEKRRNLSANSTDGVKILHGISDFTDGTTILTLADQKIVDRGVIINESDELENIEMVEMSKTKKFNDIRTGKHKFNPYGENPNSLLPQYDESDPVQREKEERMKNSFTLSGEKVEMSTEEKEERIRAKMEEAKRQKALVDGSMQLKEASDYYTREELTQFKNKNKEKIKKKRSRRKKRLEDELPPLEESVKDTDLGSRKDREDRLREEKLMEVVQVIEKRANYKKAIQKAEADSKWLFEDNNEEDDDFYKALAQARQAVQEEHKIREEVIVEQVEKTALDQRQAKKKDTRIVFNATTEFIKSIPTAADDDGMDVVEEEEESFDFEAIRQKQKERERKRKRGIDDDMDLDDENQTQKERRMDEGDSTVPDPKKEDVMGEEPLVGKGMGATLALIRARGGLNSLSLDTTIGRASDKTIDPFNRDGDLVRLEYLDEHGRQMSQKEAFRRISYSFHGKAPGKSKLEKRMKRNQEEMRRKNMSTTDTPLLTLAAMQKTQEQSKLPYVIMSGNTSKILERSVLSTPITNSSTSPGRNTPRSKHKNSNRISGGGTFKEIPLENSIPPKEEVVEKKVSFGFK